MRASWSWVVLAPNAVHSENDLVLGADTVTFSGLTISEKEYFKNYIVIR